MRNWGKILIDGLAAQGCRTLFTVPGESFIPALDALFDEGPSAPSSAGTRARRR